jgi:hypothetical protein
MLVKNRLFGIYDIKKIALYEGILGLRFVHKHTDFTMVLYSCYLPPSNSIWGRDNTAFFTTLTSEIFTQIEADSVLFCGDLNSRIGELQESIEQIDNIQKRTPIDKVKNSHGQDFIDFLRDTKMCVLNGRSNVDNDNYTFVSNRGISVVDYMFCPQMELDLYQNFRVHLLNDVITRQGLMSHLDAGTYVSDHSVLEVEIMCDQHEYYGEDYNEILESNVRRRYNFNNIPNNFMNNEMWRSALVRLVSRMETEIHDQESLDSVYNVVLLVRRWIGLL